MSHPPRVGRVRLNGALFFAHHGVSRGERELGGQYEIDVEISADLSPAARSGRLKDALDYRAVHARVERVVAHSRQALLEVIAANVMDDLFEAFPAALEVAVRLRKLNPPVGGVVRSAEVALTLTRAQWQPE